MTQTNFLELAKTGDPRVIAGLLNRSLQSQGITTKATRRSNELHLLLEGENVQGHEESIVEYLEQALSRLQVPAMPIHIYARLPGQEAVVWRHDLAYEGPKVSGPPAMLSNFTLPVPETAEPEMTSDQTLLEPQQFDDFEVQKSGENAGPDRFGSVDFSETSAETEDLSEAGSQDTAEDLTLADAYDSDVYDGYDHGQNNGNGWVEHGAEEPDAPEATPEPEVPPFQEEELSQKSGLPLLPLSLAAIVALLFAGAGAYYRFFLFEQSPEPLATISSEPLPVGTPDVVIPSPPPVSTTTPEGTPPAETVPTPTGETLPPVEVTPIASPEPVESPGTEPMPASANPWRDAVNVAMEAAQLAQTAQTAQEWGNVAETWDRSIQLLLMVPAEDPNYALAQEKVVEYTNNLDIARAQELKALGQ
jgi:hypothetical protein